MYPKQANGFPVLPSKLALSIGWISAAISGPVEVASSLGSLSNDDGDVDENGKKTIRFRLVKQQLCVCVPLFLYISLPSLHDYDVKPPNFT